MDLVTIFLSTFILIFVGELGDKTQITAGTGTLANKNNIGVIFFSSSLALVTVSGLTVFFAGLISDEYIPIITKTGGVLLCVYGVVLFLRANSPDETTASNTDNQKSYGLFVSYFLLVFMAEIGDKTQFATLAAAIENQSHLFIVFAASASALITVTGITVWGATRIPARWAKKVQQAGAMLMIAYGTYMMYSAT
jgi:putative Ca2+/H+ antiporter (TMEM165/GDT1 family)